MLGTCLVGVKTNFLILFSMFFLQSTHDFEEAAKEPRMEVDTGYSGRVCISVVLNLCSEVVLVDTNWCFVQFVSCPFAGFHNIFN